MTTIVKIPSKGVALLQSISSVYTAMQALTGIKVSGKKSNTYDSTTLDGGVFKTRDPTGYSEPVEISAGGFYNPAHASYTAFEALIATPVATNFKVTWTDSGPTSEIYSGTGFSIDKTADPKKDCVGCLQYVAAADDAHCGGCKMFKGSVNPKGYCKVWTTKVAAAPT